MQKEVEKEQEPKMGKKKKKKEENFITLIK